MTTSATYSPDDDKLRLYSSTRLDSETYARVKAAGFRWAPKQDLFFAVWSPGREDLATELAGEIDDDDSSLVDRAEERAERFEGYSENRMKDAEHARKAVEAIADGIPLGQPILVGHHSEKRARRDAAKIESGMRKAVKMWETSDYWKTRAAAALHHARYKELPGVRHRRIKTIEADKRKCERENKDAATRLQLWTNLEKIAEGERHAVALELANRIDQGGVVLADGERYWSAYSALSDGKVTAEEVRRQRLVGLPKLIAYNNRWIAHCDNRLAYERAMLAEAGIDTGRDFAKGGQVEYKGAWLRILRVNRGANGEVNSLTCEPPEGVTVRYRTGTVINPTRVGGYRPPEAADVEKARKAAKLPPICNYPGEGFREMTEAEWKARNKWSDFPYIGTVEATGTAGKHRRRQMPGNPSWNKVPVFITDAKRVDPPALEPVPEPEAKPEEVPAIDGEPIPVENQEVAPAASLSVENQEGARAEPQAHSLGAAAAPPVLIEDKDATPPAPANDPYQVMRDTLKAGGVKYTVAAQLFPTPVALAARVVDEADLKPGQRILEPSAGTGRLIDAAALSAWEWSGEIVAVESHPALASALLAKYLPPVRVRHADFLECGEELGAFDRVLMNPPFALQDDIRHVRHALKFLKPGGRLVALMAAGVEYRQDRMASDFRALVESMGGTIELLPADSFKESGTTVNAVLVVIDKA